MQHGRMVFRESLISVGTFQCDTFVDLQLSAHLSYSGSLLGYLLVKLYHLLLQVIETLFLVLVPTLQFIQLTLVEVHRISSVLQSAFVLSLEKLHCEFDELQTTDCPQDRYYRGDYNGE